MTATTHPRASRRFFRRSIAVSAVALLAVLGVSPAASAAEPTLGPNLLQNGGFEEPVIIPTATNYGLMTYVTGDTLPGWQYVSTTNGGVYVAAEQQAGAWTADPVSPAEGNQFIGLFGIDGPQVGDGGPSYRLFQQFPTEIGKTYQVSYWIAGGPNVDTLCAQLLCVASVSAGDSVGGGSLYERYFPTSSTWVHYTATYTATTTTGGIQLNSTARALGVAPLFDGVAVQELIPAVVDTPIASAPVVLLSITVAGVVLAGVLAVLGWRRRVAVAVR